VYSTLLLPLAEQTCCLEGEDGLELFDEELYALCYPDCYSYGVLEPSTILLRKRVILVFRDIIYVIMILYL
jgi:hypothetical protein